MERHGTEANTTKHSHCKRSQDCKTTGGSLHVVQSRQTIPSYPLSQSRFDVVRVHHLLRLQHAGASCHSKQCAGTGDTRHSLGGPAQAVVSKSTGFVGTVRHLCMRGPRTTPCLKIKARRRAVPFTQFNGCQLLSAVLLQLSFVTGVTVPKA